MFLGDRHAFLIKASRQPVEDVGPIHVVLDISLARPHDLDPTIDVFGNFDCANDTIHLERRPDPPLETARATCRLGFQK
jgi:hypothetical protein